MPIEFEKARAECQDCHEAIEGKLTIKAYDIQELHLGQAIDGLVITCGEHHNNNRQWGEKDLPQHAEFIVYANDKEIGFLGPVSSMTSVSKFLFSDEETHRQFSAEVRELREAHRRRWKY